MKKIKKLFIILITIIIFTTVMSVGLYKSRIYSFDFLKDIYRKIDFKLHSNELSIPRDALSFSVYDIEKGEYLFREGQSQQPTVASLAKLFDIDYILRKVDLDETVYVNQEILDFVPKGSSVANLLVGEYKVKQLIEGMLVPSGNDAAYALAYHISKKELGNGQSVSKYISHFMNGLNKYLTDEGYSKTMLNEDPSGFSMTADTHLDDINRIALKLLKYDFVRNCVSKPYFSIKTPQGEIKWENTNKFLSKKSPYYNKNVKGIKTGTMASSYNIVVLYEKEGKTYLITCLAALSDDGRYKAVQSAINTIIK
ncbi:MAG: serine hydrolase [Peptoniphilaceae bacterium]|nr:serine hydrolase [Peptoniphilaceae bacterium]